MRDSPQPRTPSATPLLTQHSGDPAESGAESLVATEVQSCLGFAAFLKVVLLVAWLGIAGLLAYMYLDEWLSSSEGYSRIYLLLSLSFVAASGLRWGLMIIIQLFEDEYNLALVVSRISSRELFESLSQALEQSAEASDIYGSLGSKRFTFFPGTPLAFLGNCLGLLCRCFGCGSCWNLFCSRCAQGSNSCLESSVCGSFRLRLLRR